MDALLASQFICYPEVFAWPLPQRRFWRRISTRVYINTPIECFSNLHVRWRDQADQVVETLCLPLVSECVLVCFHFVQFIVIFIYPLSVYGSFVLLKFVSLFDDIYMDISLFYSKCYFKLHLDLVLWASARALTGGYRVAWRHEQEIITIIQVLKRYLVEHFGENT